MSYLLCPHCGEQMDIFGSGGGAAVSTALGRVTGTRMAGAQGLPGSGDFLAGVLPVRINAGGCGRPYALRARQEVFLSCPRSCLVWACRRGPRAKTATGRWLKNHPIPGPPRRTAPHVPRVADGT